MTGFGDARTQTDDLCISVEIRSVNNRHLKISTRLPDSYTQFESDIEKVIRERVSRGTINVMIRADRAGSATGPSICSETLGHYLAQAKAFAEQNDLTVDVSLESLLSLPGVVREASVSREDASEDWPSVQGAVEAAIEKLHGFRTAEGRSMEDDLLQQHTAISRELERVSDIAPQVVSEYRTRLLERVRDMLAESEATVEPNDLIREVSVFADRVDINEEITRLRHHLNQFVEFVSADRSMGRKLEFLGQEIFREVNTIGSKANNVRIAHCVVEMKSAIEKVREIVQNVE